MHAFYMAKLDARIRRLLIVVRWINSNSLTLSLIPRSPLDLLLYHLKPPSLARLSNVGILLILRLTLRSRWWS